ncbi:hypothetical protein KI440_04030 [Candidatus Saccharibacteria bacterium TM7i]|nr:hypothetical protein KI440_04030 [Candidatus Saccharibacteria bacterium TM7i]
MIHTVRTLQEFSRVELLEQRDHLVDTIEKIEKNLQAPNFYEADRQEVLKNKEFYEGRLHQINTELGARALAA